MYKIKRGYKTLKRNKRLLHSTGLKILNEHLWDNYRLHNVALLNWIILLKNYIIVIFMILQPPSVCHLHDAIIHPNGEQRKRARANHGDLASPHPLRHRRLPWDVVYQKKKKFQNGDGGTEDWIWPREIWGIGLINSVRLPLCQASSTLTYDTKKTKKENLIRRCAPGVVSRSREGQCRVFCVLTPHKSCPSMCFFGTDAFGRWLLISAAEGGGPLTGRSRCRSQSVTFLNTFINAIFIQGINPCFF